MNSDYSVFSADSNEGSVRGEARMSLLRHELKTPLVSLLALTAELGREPLDARQRTILDALAASGKHLAGLVDRLVTNGSFESRTRSIRAQWLDTCRFLESTLLAHWGGARLRGIGLHLVTESGLPRQWRVDGLRLREILDNLLANAMKATSEGHVVLRARRVARTHSEPFIELSVEDTGQGLDEALGEQMYRRGVQGFRGACRNGTGSGIGLFVCRQLAAELGGWISHRPRRDVGAAFTLTAPVGPRPPSRLRSVRPGVLRLLHCTVALPEPMSAAVISMLRRAGIKAGPAINGYWNRVRRGLEAVVCDGDAAARAVGGRLATEPAAGIVIVFASGRHGEPSWRVVELPEPVLLGTCEPVLLDAAMMLRAVGRPSCSNRVSGSPDSAQRRP